jgi:DNA primase
MPTDDAKELVNTLNKQTYDVMKRAHRFYAASLRDILLLVPSEDQKKMQDYVERRLISFPYKESEYYDD